MAWDDELAALMPPEPDTMGPPPTAPREVLGLPVPASYILFCERWGDGGSLLDEIALFGFGDAADRDDLAYRNSLPYKARQFVETYGWQKNGRPDKYALPLAPAPGSLLPFGIDGNGNWYGWLVEERPGEWPVAILMHEDGMPTHTGLDFPGFMLAIARRELPPEVLHPSLLARPLTFEPRRTDLVQA